MIFALHIVTTFTCQRNDEYLFLHTTQVGLSFHDKMAHGFRASGQSRTQGKSSWFLFWPTHRNLRKKLIQGLSWTRQFLSWTRLYIFLFLYMVQKQAIVSLDASCWREFPQKPINDLLLSLSFPGNAVIGLRCCVIPAKFKPSLLYNPVLTLIAFERYRWKSDTV